MLAGAGRRHRPIFSGVLSSYFHLFLFLLFHLCQGRVVFWGVIFFFFVVVFGQEEEGHSCHKVTLFSPFLPEGEGRP